MYVIAQSMHLPEWPLRGGERKNRKHPPWTLLLCNILFMWENEHKDSLPHFKLAEYSIALNTDLLCVFTSLL